LFIVWLIRLIDVSRLVMPGINRDQLPGEQYRAAHLLITLDQIGEMFMCSRIICWKLPMRKARHNGWMLMLQGIQYGLFMLREPTQTPKGFTLCSIKSSLVSINKNPGQRQLWYVTDHSFCLLLIIPCRFVMWRLHHRWTMYCCWHVKILHRNTRLYETYSQTNWYQKYQLGGQVGSYLENSN
jgi:hypothetical protein